jgi:hypothetical protein
MGLSPAKLIKARSNQAEKLISVWCPAQLKRDVKRIAAAERKSQSLVCAGLIRLGIARFFDEADDAKLEPLRAAMKDLFFLGEPDPEIVPAPKLKPFSVKPKFRPRSEISARWRREDAEFAAAIKEGQRHFKNDGIRNPYRGYQEK